MDFKQIQELIKLVNKSNIGELSVEENDFKITIKQKQEGPQTVVMPTAAQLPPIQAVTKTDPPKNGSADTAREDRFVTIKSPMIGPFYRQSAPGKPIFV